MILHLRNRLTIVLTLLVFHVSAQTDTIAQANLKKYRQTFWDHIPKPSGWVNDYEDIYAERQEMAMDSMISIYKGSTGIEIAIVTIDTHSVSKERFSDLALDIANKWGVGEKGKNNGVLVAISKGYRQMRIENGKGIEKMLTDAETQEIINKYFIPDFKKGNYYKGTAAGLTRLMNVLRARVK